MKTLRHVRLFLLALFFPVSYMNGAIAENRDLVRIVYAESWKPVSWADGNHATGLLPDRIKSILTDHLGIRVLHIPAPWGRAQEMVRNGKVDAFVTTATEKRLRYASPSELPVFHLPFVLTIRRDSAHMAHDDPDDLSLFSNQQFCDVLGNGWAQQFYKDKPVQIYWAPRIEECLKLLINNRVTGIVHAQSVTIHYAEQLGIKDNIIVHDNPAASSPAFPILVSRKSPWHGKLAPLVDKYLRQERAPHVNSGVSD